MKYALSLFILLLVGVFLSFYFPFNKLPLEFFPRYNAAEISPQHLQAKLAKTEARLSKNPDDLEAMVDRGIIFFLMGKDHYSDSLNAFNAAWQAGALDRRIFYYSAILYENITLFEEAKKHYERFLRHEPEDRETRLRLARLLFRMDLWDEALESYETLIASNPRDITSLVNAGLACSRKAELARSQKQKLTGAQINDVNAVLDQGIKHLEAAAKIQNYLPEGAYLALSKLYAMKGDTAASVRAGEQELSFYPKSADACEILLKNYEQAQDWDKAVPILEKLIDLEPQTISYQQKLARMKRKLKKS